MRSAAGLFALLVLLAACQGPASQQPPRSSHAESRSQPRSQTQPEPGPRYYSAQLHLHGPFSEGAGTMRGHNAEARRLGLDVLWWTDHEWRLARHTFLDGYDFDQQTTRREIPHRGAPWSKRPRRIRFGWEAERWGAPLAEARAETSRRFVSQGEGALELAATARPGEPAWGWSGVHLTSPGGRFRTSLAVEVVLNLAVRLPPSPPGDGGSEDAQLVLRLELSRQPEGLAELWYLIGAEGEPTVERRGGLLIGQVPVPAQAGWWTDLSLPVTQDVLRLGPELGGMDNSLRRIHLAVRARRGASLTASVDDLRIRTGMRGQNVIKRQQEMALAAMRESGITNHVGLEISYGVHMNAYLPQPQIPDLGRTPHGLSPEEIVAWAHARGGVVSWNHVFGASFDSLEDEGSDEEGGEGEGNASRQEIEERARYAVDNGAFGADLLEVGYPSRVLPLADHLAVWDRLSRQRTLLTPIGTSDSHGQRGGWREGNNFVTWIWAESPGAADLIAGLRQGRVFFGDPERFKGRLELSAEPAAEGQRRWMGKRLWPAQGPSERVRLEVTDLPPGSRLRWIVDGEVTEEKPLPEGSFEDVLEVGTTTYRFVRAEIWNGDRGLVFSSCLYFVPGPGS